jgi:hypothetical protein
MWWLRCVSTSEAVAAQEVVVTHISEEELRQRHLAIEESRIREEQEKVRALSTLSLHQHQS